MNQDRSQEESSHPQLYAQLGEFSKLPPELRFQIWDCLFEDFFKNSSDTPRALSILSCNRSLHEETSYILYERPCLRLHIVLQPLFDEDEEYRLTGYVKAAKRGRNLRYYKTIQLGCFDHALRLLRNFPSWRVQKCGPRIYISYSHLLYPSEDLWLWECVHKIVNTLKLIPNGKNITFNTFRPPRWSKNPTLHLTNWFNERYPGEPLPYRSCDRPDSRDHDYPLGPFLRIPVYHYVMLQAMDSIEQRQLEQERLAESAAQEK